MMKPLSTVWLWFMIGWGVLLVGAILGIGWNRNGLRRIAPVAGGVALVWAVGVGLFARFGIPPFWVTAPLVVVCLSLSAWFSRRAARLSTVSPTGE